MKIERINPIFRNMLGSVHLIGSVLLAIIYISCSKTPVVSTPGEETTNGISGIVKQGTEPASGVVVILFPASFNPIVDPVPDSMQQFSNSKGEYFFANAEKGIYNIYASDSDGLFNAIIQNVEVPDVDDTVVTVTVAELKEPGNITIQLEELSVEKNGYVYLPGTSINAYVDAVAIENGSVSMNEVPPNTYPNVQYVSPTDSIGKNILLEAITVSTGELAVVGPFHTWPFSTRITINTTPSGADVINGVFNFPLLVRLSPNIQGSDLIIQNSQIDGADIRFANSAGVPLPYEIERWDSLNEMAEIWVRVDTIAGNNNTQYITMYWGKNDAVDRSDGAKVYDTVNGFAGVWHLDEEAAGTTETGLYKNSTRDADHGNDKLHSIDSGGIIGNGHYFDGSEYIHIPNPSSLLKPAVNISLSGWYKTDSSDIEGSVISTMGDSYGLKIDNAGTTRMFGWINNNFEGPITSPNIMDGKWHYIVGTYNGVSIDSYLDGNLLLKDTVPGILSYDLGTDFFIGTHGNGQTNFDAIGHIDEIRVSSLVRSPDWIKLCFENQKEKQTLVIIE